MVADKVYERCQMNKYGSRITMIIRKRIIKKQNNSNCSRYVAVFRELETIESKHGNKSYSKSKSSQQDMANSMRQSRKRTGPSVVVYVSMRDASRSAVRVGTKL